MGRTTARAAEPAAAERADWHAAPLEAVVAALGVEPARGLTADEAARRLARDGPNALPEARARTAWATLLEQFRNPMVALLLLAGAVAAAAGDRFDAWAIFAVVVLNGAIGFATEHRAAKEMRALRALSALRARVLRDGRTQTVPSEQLVPGDVVRLDAGDRVPADVRLLGTTALTLSEAALTGESLPVLKDAAARVGARTPLSERATMAYLGTTVVRGRGQGLVVATGRATEMGLIAALVDAAGRDGATPLQRRLARLARGLIGAVAAVAAGLVAVGLGHGEPLAPMLQTGLALAVAAVPEGLPTVATVALAIGMRRMAARGALIRRIDAIETLGAVTVVCADKTGTLTRNEIVVDRIVLPDRRIVELAGAGYAPEGTLSVGGEPLGADAAVERALTAALLCSDARLARLPDGGWGVDGDPTEGALVVAARKYGLGEDVVRAAPRVGELPFDPVRMRMATSHRLSDGAGRTLVKGAPEGVLAASRRWSDGRAAHPIDRDTRAWLETQNARLASEGRRVLALAEAQVGGDPFADLTLLALVAQSDPPRPEAAEAVARARRAGIRVLVLTGDQPATASAIAGALGLNGRAGTAAAAGAGDPARWDALVDELEVFARVTPEEKLRLVEALQRRGEVVAMTGDGVNDAPALERADVGVAMGRRGTDAAREAADVVLTDDNLATILDAVEEGRVVGDNIRRVVRYLLGCNLAEVAVMAAALLLGMPLPLLPLQLLWLNLVTDVLPAFALATEPAEAGLMRRRPVDPRAGLVDPRAVAAAGAVLALAVLAAFAWALGAPGGDPTRARTVAFAALGAVQVLHTLNVGRAGGPGLRRLLPSRGLLAAGALTGALQVAAVHLGPLAAVLHTVPLEPTEWLVVLAAAVVPVALLQLRGAFTARSRAATGRETSVGDACRAGTSR